VTVLYTIFFTEQFGEIIILIRDAPYDVRRLKHYQIVIPIGTREWFSTCVVETSSSDNPVLQSVTAPEHRIRIKVYDNTLHLYAFNGPRFSAVAVLIK